jgi:hypothetical protein
VRARSRTRVRESASTLQKDSRTDMTSRTGRLALFAVTVPHLAAGCGAGAAAVVASSGSSGGGSSAPAIVNLSLSATKRSPARIEFQLQNAAASVELRYHAPGDPPGSFRPMQHLVGGGRNPGALGSGHAAGRARAWPGELAPPLPQLAKPPGARQPAHRADTAASKRDHPVPRATRRDAPLLPPGRVGPSFERQDLRIPDRGLPCHPRPALGIPSGTACCLG